MSSPEPPPADHPPAPPDWTDPDVPLGAGIDWSDPNSPLARVYLTPAAVLAVALVAFAGWLVAGWPLMQTDIWGHLAYGRWAVEHRELPDREPLNPYTDKAVPIFHSMWLSQAGYYLLYDLGGRAAGGDPARRMAGGIEFVTAAHALVVVAALGFLTLAYYRASGSMPLAVLGLVVAGLTTISTLYVQRPQAVGIACFAAVLAAVAGPVPPRRALVLVPAVFAFWVNAHGTFVVGLALIGLTAAGRAVEAAYADGRWSVRAAVADTGFRRLVLLLLLSAAACCLNPYGPGVYRRVLAFSGHPVIALFDEWQPLDFGGAGRGYLMYVGAVLACIGVLAVSPRPLGPTGLLWTVTLGVWPLVQQRSWVWWAAALPCVLLPHLASLARRSAEPTPPAVGSLRMTLAAGAVAVGTLLLTPAFKWARTGSPRPLSVSAARGTPIDVAAALYGAPGPAFPERAAALAAVRDQLGAGPPGVVFATETAGEYLVWAAPPGSPITMFTHGHLFALDYWNECRLVKAAGPGWWEALDRRRANVLVIAAGVHPELSAAVRGHPDWAVALDEPAVPGRPLDNLLVAVRKSPFPDRDAP